MRWCVVFARAFSIADPSCSIPCFNFSIRTKVGDTSCPMFVPSLFSHTNLTLARQYPLSHHPGQEILSWGRFILFNTSDALEWRGLVADNLYQWNEIHSRLSLLTFYIAHFNINITLGIRQLRAGYTCREISGWKSPSRHERMNKTTYGHRQRTSMYVEDYIHVIELSVWVNEVLHVFQRYAGAECHDQNREFPRSMCLPKKIKLRC